MLGVDDDRAERLRAQGFTTAMAVPQLGMFNGQTAAVSLNGRGPDSAVLGGGIAQSVVLGRDNRACERENRGREGTPSAADGREWALCSLT
jgi:hypothetical protein